MMPQEQKLIDNSKAALRREYLGKRRAFDSERKALLDSAVCRNLLRSGLYSECDALLAYYPSQRLGEINILPILEAALADGKALALPVCNKKNGENHMDFHRVYSLDCLTLGSFSIPEPPQDSEIIDIDAFRSTLCILPGIVFDTEGYRIGYGGGYYDRFLAESPKVKTVGLIITDFTVDTLPHGEFDIPADIIINETETEGGIFVCRQKTGSGIFSNQR